MMGRTEIEIAANTLWALVEAGHIRTDVKMRELCRVVGITLDDLRLASIRHERVPATRLAPSPAAVQAPHPVTPRWEVFQPPRKERVSTRVIPPPVPRAPVTTITTLPPAERKAAARAVFALLRASGNLTCTRCGKPMHPTDPIEIEAAHHAGNCPGPWGNVEK